ncbi:unnamed protein product [Protopolystoma xenopodis]|uniref:Uncharacterized protein n=1 Tax=Protopolystoma xenopodis TaxID=117903 RepID=A0A448X5A7_9PLAT|nr:unnamed protein product [Protopolystoma xenopodis]
MFYGQAGGTLGISGSSTGGPDSAPGQTSAFLPRSSTGSSGTGTDTISLSTTNHLIAQAVSGSGGLPGSPGILGQQQQASGVSSHPTGKMQVRKHLLQVRVLLMF